MYSRQLALLLVLCLCPALCAGESQPTYPPPAEVKAAFLKLLERPRVALDVQQHGKAVKDRMETLQESFASEKKADRAIERVPVLIMRPVERKARLPAVIVLHGTGGNKESQQGFMRELAKRGIIGVAIDARYHGQRAAGAKGAAAYNAAIIRAWRSKPGARHEYPFYYDTCWDLWRTVDYLQQRDDVDPNRIGMIGFSMGGIETYLAASVDDRVKVAVPAIGVQSFRWSLEHDRWQGRARTIGAAHQAAAKDLGEPKVSAKVCRALWAKVVPGITDQFDCPSMLRLFAGRALLILSGEKDGNCPIEGARLAFAAAEKAFRDAGATERLRIMVAPVGHAVTAEQRRAALDWFARWLK